MRWVEHDTPLGAKFFAHVLVHEITHTLQMVGRHSETGVMKALWTEDDLALMRRKALPFEPTDVLLIRVGIEQRARRQGRSPAANSAGIPADRTSR